MDGTDITKVFETTDAGCVNKYLNAGWILLGISKTIGDAVRRLKPSLLYSLGWMASRGDVMHPNAVSVSEG